MNNCIVRLLFDRKKVTSNNPNKLAPIQLYISYKGKRCQINTDIYVRENNWKSGRIRGHKQIQELNRKLDSYIDIASSYIEHIDSNNRDFSTKELKRLLNNNKPIDFLTWAIQNVRSKDVKDSTKQRYFSMFNSIKEFGKINTFEDLTKQTINAWDKFAHIKCNKPAGVYNYHKILKTLCRDAHYQQLIERNPYDGRRLDYGVDKNNRKYLNQQELERLVKTKMDTPFLERVRDLFLFSCYIGMTYADWCNFNINKCYNDNGRLRYEEKRVKSGVKFCITLLPPAISILEKYKTKLPIITLLFYHLYLD